MSKHQTKVRATTAIQFLKQAGVEFTPFTYEYENNHDKKGHHDGIGVQAADAIDRPAEIVYKTLIVLVDNAPVCAAIPSNANLAMKKIASAVGGKTAHMIEPHDAERITGFKVGGISPFGHRKKIPIVFDSSMLSHEVIYINGGARGLVVELSPNTAIEATKAIVADITQ